MGEPARKFSEIEPDIRPNLRGIDGGGQSTPGRASLKAVNNQESNIKKPSNNTDDVKNAEETPDKGYANNYTGANAASSKSGGFMAAVKKKSPILAIVLTLIFGGMGIIGVSGPLMLPQTILAKVVQTFNIQETSATIRTNKLFSSKMSSTLTDGSCNIIKVFCRFSRPSNRFLKELEKNGIKAFNSKGIIESGGLFPNARPSVYQFVNEAGESVYVQASELTDKLYNNAELRGAFHESSKTRFRSLTDSIFDSIKAKFGFSTTNKFTNVSADDTTAVDGETGTKSGQTAGEEVADTLDDNKNMSDIIDDNVKVDDSGIGAAVASGSDDVIGDAVTDQLTDVITDETTRVAKNGKGDAINLAAGIICGVADTPGMITKAVRGFQMAQLIKYSALFLAVFGAIKAGDAKANEVSAVGKALTETVSGKSAMDSFGIRNTLSGDILPKDNKFKKFSPGGSVIAALGGVVAVTNSKVKKGACDTMTNPLTGEAINAALAANAGETFGATLAAAAINIVAGYILSEIIQAAAPTIIGAVMSVIDVKGIMGFFLGDLTKGLVGEEVGDALISGASHVMGQTGNAGGNMPLNVKQAIAYGETTKQVQLAYAEEDRATKSPFDISSPNTMMGSIVQKLVPYLSPSYQIAGLASSSFASLMNVIAGSFSTILSPLSVKAVDPAEGYKLCDDPEMNDNDIAAGPYCNIIYGVPPQYLDKEPVTVVNELVASGDINEDTGDVIPDSSMDKWVNLCTGGDTSQARNCKIDDKTANYALYTIDHRVQESMDEEPSSSSSSSSSDSSSNTPADEVNTPDTSDTDSKTKIELAKMIIDSGNVYDKTDQIKKIAAGNKTILNIKILKLIANLAKDNKFAISDLVRSLAATYGAKNSQHKLGLAVDFSGSSGINGVKIPTYGSYSSKIQSFLNEISDLLGSGCRAIGVPNTKYINSTDTNCNVFKDIGTGPHIHVGISP